MKTKLGLEKKDSGYKQLLREANSISRSAAAEGSTRPFVRARGLTDSIASVSDLSPAKRFPGINTPRLPKGAVPGTAAVSVGTAHNSLDPSQEPVRFRRTQHASTTHYTHRRLSKTPGPACSV